MNCVYLTSFSHLYLYVYIPGHFQFSTTINIISRYIKLQWCSEIINLLFTAGEFGIVYRAQLIRSTLRRTDCEIVAVKTVKGKDMIQPCQLHMLPLMLFLLCTIKAKWEFYEVLSHDCQGLYYFHQRYWAGHALMLPRMQLPRCHVGWLGIDTAAYYQN